MLAIDTNIAVRFLVRDDPAQSERARAIVSDSEVYVTPTVLLETEWVLRNFYELPRHAVLGELERFCGMQTVTVGAAEMVDRALGFAERGLDFADALHLAQSGDCDAFVTFDKRLEHKARSFEGVVVRLG